MRAVVRSDRVGAWFVIEQSFQRGRWRDNPEDIRLTCAGVAPRVRASHSPIADKT